MGEKQYKSNTAIDVLPNDIDPVVPVPAFVFMPESDGVHEFVDGGVVLDAAVVQRHLLPPPCPPHVRKTPQTPHLSFK